MECKKCHLDVPAHYEYAIAQNTCPKCGAKLMNEMAMKMFLRLKKDLHQVQLIMDPEVNYEKIAMYLVNNYSVRPFEDQSDEEDNDAGDGTDFEEGEEDVQSRPDDMTDEEYREYLAEKAEERMLEEAGTGIDIGSAQIDAVQKKVARLKKVAKQARAANKGSFEVRRVGEGE